jgi:hypothetical protein
LTLSHDKMSAKELPIIAESTCLTYVIPAKPDPCQPKLHVPMSIEREISVHEVEILQRFVFSDTDGCDSLTSLNVYMDGNW